MATLDLIELGDYADSGELTRIVEELFDTETNPLRSPAYLFVTIRRPGSTTAVLASDHSVTDAFSMASVPFEIKEFYAAAIQGAVPRLALAHSYLDYAVSKRARVTNLTDEHPAIGHWRELIAANGGELPDFPVPLGAVGGALQLTSRTWHFDAETARRSIERVVPNAEMP
ncbi:hypothetical protein [Bradyrhizobium sp. CCGB01]|uniref:hypothetical protein n=1 Tax=Bradyrhizobium sp. CCGB01 TaxID=2949634 RepID=UPI0020B3D724|nr:hypothetical protein [Bradyrhizobium sp. CCGB01]MCP3405432.1 hypothetical protein [Bradyrhizobium sp. CCGB01]